MPIWCYKKLSQTLKDETNPVLYDHFSKQHRKCSQVVHETYTLPNRSHARTVHGTRTLPNRSHARTVEGREVTRPVSLTNTDANLLHKIIADKTNQWINNIKYNNIRFISKLSKSGLTSKIPINIIQGEVL